MIAGELFGSECMELGWFSRVGESANEQLSSAFLSGFAGGWRCPGQAGEWPAKHSPAPEFWALFAEPGSERSLWSEVPECRAPHA